MYLGSYGDSENSWRIQVGLLEIYLKKGSILWPGGMCVYSSQDTSKAQQAIILIGGVAVSLAIATLGFYGTLMFDLHGSVKLYMALLTLLAAITLITNLAAYETERMATDGLQLKRLITGEKAVAPLSPELQALIAQSREVAIDLGYNYISTLHLFLADCAMPYHYSLGKLFFQDEEAQQAFYEQHRVGLANCNAGSLPLTTEFEEALRLTPTTQRHGLCEVLHPCHLFLAASGMPNSEFSRVIPEPTNLPQRLLTHYRAFSELGIN
ncbi:hypothetical protein [Hymenobacter arizonensis]|nr:hypothetical protein [Hymenobacter arizonensis]